uniref:Isoform 3 of PIH1 domain-containing protein 1 n=1 Tax=Homo sapiens TaxID=9606 RepID=Q9NWS0-3
MANPKLLGMGLSEAEAIGADSARFEELLLQASKELQQAQTTRPESTQIQPQPGFCIKTNSSEGKVFINICHSPSIPPPADVTEEELLQMLEEDQAGFRIPMSLGEPHAELDASQCPQRTQESGPLGPFFPRTQESWAQDPPPSAPGDLAPRSDSFPYGRSLVPWTSHTRAVLVLPPGQAGTFPCPTPGPGGLGRVLFVH